MHCASIRKYNTTYKVRVRCGFSRENPREIRHFEGAKSDNTHTTLLMDFNMGTSVNWLREARTIIHHHDVRVVLLAQTSGFPAGYVGLLDDDETSFDSENIGPHDMVTIVLYDFSLLDLSYTVRIDGDEQSTTKIKVRTVDLWPLFGDERFPEEPPFGTTTPTLKKLNDAALTLASMLVTDAEYRVMRNAILTNQ